MNAPLTFSYALALLVIFLRIRDAKLEHAFQHHKFNSVAFILNLLIVHAFTQE